ncbi:reverse transcriptase domain protein [Colletotrichum truncatum]|uniref:Reverse transcriptase domain protein n=1 Tax=Colletotrichum truncatum TaxID=5467 RepID=A0ACC3ZHL6_COLTU|nr:reverse transcriptase domain protein [Colletotrichum truncatum]KAF6781007.1 reverse transcriptase domain protein [Colletotrichum truncatum]
MFSSSYITTSLGKAPELNCRRDFPIWYITLHVEAKGRDIWQFVDPDDFTSPSGPGEIEDVIYIDSWIGQQIKKQHKIYEAKRAAYDEILQARDFDSLGQDDDNLPQKPVNPLTLAINTNGIFQKYIGYLSGAARRDLKRTRQEESYEALRRWVEETVAQGRMYM